MNDTPKRSNHFDNVAIDKGTFPDHISRDGTAYYSDGTALRPARAPIETVSDKDKATQMDWQQVILNGGPPCFAQLDDEAGWYCGRAQRWAGHDGEHRFISLQAYVATVRREAREQAFKEILERVESINVKPGYGGASGSVMKQCVLIEIAALERAADSGEGENDGEV